MYFCEMTYFLTYFFGMVKGYYMSIMKCMFKCYDIISVCENINSQYLLVQIYIYIYVYGNIIYIYSHKIINEISQYV